MLHGKLLLFVIEIEEEKTVFQKDIYQNMVSGLRNRIITRPKSSPDLNLSSEKYLQSGEDAYRKYR